VAIWVDVDADVSAGIEGVKGSEDDKSVIGELVNAEDKAEELDELEEAVIEELVNAEDIAGELDEVEEAAADKGVVVDVYKVDGGVDVDTRATAELVVGLNSEDNVLELQLPWPHLLVTHRVYFTGSLYGFSLRVLFSGPLFGQFIRNYCTHSVYIYGASCPSS